MNGGTVARKLPGLNAFDQAWWLWGKRTNEGGYNNERKFPRHRRREKDEAGIDGRPLVTICQWGKNKTRRKEDYPGREGGFRGAMLTPAPYLQR